MTNNEYETVLKNIGTNVRRLRKQKGYSQFELSYASDLNRTNIGYIENAKNDVFISTLCTLAKALDVSIEELTASPPEK